MKRYLSILFALVIMLCLCFGIKNLTIFAVEKFIDYNNGVDTLSDNESISLVREITSFLDTGIEIAEKAEDSNDTQYFYFKNESDENKLEIYHRNYIKDSAYSYLLGMYQISRFKSKLVKNVGDYGFIRYKIDSRGDFKVVSRNDSEICVEVPFIKKDSLGGDLSKLEKGKVFLNLSDDGKWRISKISHWYDDLAFYELGEYIDYFFDSKNNVKTNYEDFILKYGYDSKGNKISMKIIRYPLDDQILSTSSQVLLGEYTDIYRLNTLSKLAAHIAYEEIYARHGKTYDKYSIEYNYFNQLDWYKENNNFNENELNDVEIHNLEVIKKYMDKF